MKTRMSRKTILAATVVPASFLATLTVQFSWLRMTLGRRQVRDFWTYLETISADFLPLLIPAGLIGLLALEAYNRFKALQVNQSTPRQPGIRSRLGAIAAMLGAFCAVMWALTGLIYPVENVTGVTWLVTWGFSLLASAAIVATERLKPAWEQRGGGLNRSIQILIDGIVIGLAFLGSYWIRFDGFPSDLYQRQMLVLLPYIIGSYLLAMIFWGVYSFLWRFTGLKEVLIISQPVALVGVGWLVIRFLFLGDHPTSRLPFGVLVLQPIVTYLGFLAARALRRMHHKSAEKGRRPQTAGTEPRRILLVGAGQTGRLLLRDLENNPNFEVVGFLDDDQRKFNRLVGGFRVYGSCDQIEEICSRFGVRHIVLSMPSASRHVIRTLVNKCESASIQALSVPALSDIVSGRVSVGQLRPVNMEDLLRRPSVVHRNSASELDEAYRGRRIMVTGAAGSIGSELVRQLIGISAQQLILLDQDESGLFEIVLEIQELSPETQVSEFVADIRDEDALKHAFEQARPDVIFHAAAYKHVPLMERHPAEAVLNNVLGSRNLLKLASEYGVARFVLISSDKAVNPANIMGATKRVAELSMQQMALQSPNTLFCAVRFGNVLGSRASVIPIFQRRIREGKDIEVTHRDICRYFMTIPEAVQLVIQAGTLGAQGEIFVLDMGDPVRIVDLARELIELSGLQLDRDIKIRFTGLRPGEKLYEELLVDESSLDVRSTKFPKIFVERAKLQGWVRLEDDIADLMQAARDREDARIRSLLDDLSIGFHRAPEGTPEVVANSN